MPKKHAVLRALIVKISLVTINLGKINYHNITPCDTKYGISARPEQGIFCINFKLKSGIIDTKDINLCHLPATGQLRFTDSRFKYRLS